jgi:hypothetical protein
MKKNSFIILTILIAVFILSNCSNQKIVAKNTAIEVATNPIGNIVKHDCNSFASAYPVKMNVLYIVLTTLFLFHHLEFFQET